MGGGSRSPHLDAFAARGILFRNAWSYQACSPTLAALLTGRHSDRTGVGGIIRVQDGVYTPLALSEMILPEALPGYRNAALGNWHLQDSGDGPTHPPPFLLTSTAPPVTVHEQRKVKVETLDTIFGRVVAQVDLTNTYVFAIGDNGSPASTVTAPFASTHCKNSMHEGVLRIPFPGTTGGLDIYAVRTRRWKLIDSVTTGQTRLYDLAADPFETNDLLVTQPGPVTDALRDRLLALTPQFP